MPAEPLGRRPIAELFQVLVSPRAIEGNVFQTELGNSRLGLAAHISLAEHHHAGDDDAQQDHYPQQGELPAERQGRTGLAMGFVICHAVILLGKCNFSHTSGWSEPP